MLIETSLKPRAKPSRKVRCFGVDYDFKPLPGLPDRFVAEVNDQRTIDALLATGAYTEFTDKLPESNLLRASQMAASAMSAVSTAAAPPSPPTASAPAPSEPPPPAPPPASTPGQNAAGDQGTGEGEQSDDGAPPADEANVDEKTVEAAKNLLTEPAKSIREKVKNGPTEAHPAEVLRTAAALEKAEKQPRPTVVDALERALAPKA